MRLPEEHGYPDIGETSKAGLFSVCRRLPSHFLKTASSPACAIASSISDLAPLAAMPPIVLPSTLIGSPP